MAVNSFNAQNPPVTTKGDVFTFSTVPTRLGVGANNTVLTADSTTATGLKWATPSAGSMTLLSTTAMSGSATVTISSINQTYKKLVVYLKDFYPSGSTAQMSLYMNGFNSGNSYFGVQVGARGSTTFREGMSNNSGFNMTAGFLNYLITSQTNNFAVVTFEDYANTDSRKIVSWQIGATNDAGTVTNAFGMGTNYGDIFDSAISSISFNTNSGTWTAGTIYTYGVN